MANVTGSFTATGQSASFQPVIRDRGWGQFNITLTGTGVGSVQLERNLDGTNWAPIYAAGTQLFQWTYAGTNLTEIGEENERGAQYRLNCTSYTSGTITYRISQ